MKLEKVLKISFTKSGAGSVTNRITLPTTWIRSMGITESDREVDVTLEDGKIIISKKK